MNSSYMCYYTHLAKLSVVANKQTLFLAHMLYRMEWHEESKQYVVNLNAHQKRDIMKAINFTGKTSLIRMANQYLNTISKSGLIQPAGGGMYLLDPRSYSGSKYVPKKYRDRGGVIYETRTFTSECEGEVETYIVTEDGERIDL